ncbi:MSCRAMM family protein [Candidatus Electrothrix sp.]|uniref:MSCRAMM family protein n=1 Tax=Candidatus Electrothrix sp. TaxID=2170559 RepID=UPI0040569306
MKKCSSSYLGVGCSLASASTVTAVDGTYMFSDLALGEYRIAAPANWEDTPYEYQRKEIQVTEEEQSIQVDFELEQASTINGIIRNGDGGTLTAEELDKVYLAVYQSQEEACDCIFSNYICAISTPFYPVITISADGSYSISGLSPGSYFVAARGAVATNYIPEWSGGITSVSQCDIVESVDISSSGSQVNDIDFQLDSGATVQGTVYYSSDISVDELRVGLIINKPDTNQDPCDFTSSMFTADVREDGTYTVAGLPPGEYSLFASSIMSSSDVNNEWLTGINTDSSPDCLLVERLIVTSDEPKQLFDQRNFQLGTGGNISGTVFQADGQRPVDDIYYVRFQQSCVVAGDEPEVTVVSGQYTSPVLPAGDYFLALLNHSSELVGWRTASGILSPDCTDADSVQVDEDHTTSGINFFLNKTSILPPIDLTPVYYMLLHRQPL